jgi:hypothetical protein
VGAGFRWTEPKIKGHFVKSKNVAKKRIFRAAGNAKSLKLLLN